MFNTAKPYVSYLTTPNQRLYPFLFWALDDEDLIIYYTAQAETEPRKLELAVDYTVALDTPNGGSIELTFDPLADEALSIERSLSVDRLITYQSNGDLTSDTLNLDQDYQTYLIQDNSERNLIRLPDGSESVGIEGLLPFPVGDKFLQWNHEGTKLVNGDSTEGPQGQQGVQGPEGQPGSAGGTGATGEQGIEGPTGVQGPQGQTGIAGSGVEIQGSDTIANILLKTPTAGMMWIATDTDIVVIQQGVPGDGYVGDGSIWTNVGPIRGPEGLPGDNGIEGPQGNTGQQGITGPQGPQGIQGEQGIPGPSQDVPIGTIVMFNGTILDIPANWALCDGTNNTPNLVDRFIYGTNTQGEILDEGGSANAITPAHNHLGPSHTHSVASHSHAMGSHYHGMNHDHPAGTTGTDAHTHTVTDGYTNATANGLQTGGYDWGPADITRTTSSDTHSHSFNVANFGGNTGSTDPGDTYSGGSGNTGASGTNATGTTGSSSTNANIPPYVKLAYIQKIS